MCIKKALGLSETFFYRSQFFRYVRYIKSTEPQQEYLLLPVGQLFVCKIYLEISDLDHERGEVTECAQNKATKTPSCQQHHRQAHWLLKIHKI